jgi:hypothetical protein
MNTLGLQPFDLEAMQSAMDFFQTASTLVVVSLWTLAGACLFLESRSESRKLSHTGKRSPSTN